MKEQDEHEKIIEIYKQIGEQERHFNELERNYRVLTSQWLLASLGAIGFLLQSDKFILSDNYKILLIGAIGLAGNFGIFLLWLIDIRVYHKLLNCAFLHGVKLEQKNSWLPKIRTDMLLSQYTGDVVKNTGLFYMGSCSLLTVISITSFTYYFKESIWGFTLVLITGIVLLVSQIFYMIKKGSNPRAMKLYDMMIKEYKDDIIQI